MWWWAFLVLACAVIVVQLVITAAPWWSWAVYSLFAALIAWSFVTMGSHQVAIHADGHGGGWIKVSGGTLPFDAIGKSIAVPASAKQAAMGRQLDPTAFISHRFFIKTLVLIVVDDPEDDTPYWLVSCKDPHAVVKHLPATQWSSTKAAHIE